MNISGETIGIIVSLLALGVSGIGLIIKTNKNSKDAEKRITQIEIKQENADNVTEEKIEEIRVDVKDIKRCMQDIRDLGVKHNSEIEFIKTRLDKVEGKVGL